MKHFVKITAERGSNLRTETYISNIDLTPSKIASLTIEYAATLGLKLYDGVAIYDEHLKDMLCDPSIDVDFVKYLLDTGVIERIKSARVRLY